MDDEYSNFIAVHHEFVASAKVVIAGHRINPVILKKFSVYLTIVISRQLEFVSFI
jgi:hypothetical protein